MIEQYNEWIKEGNEYIVLLKKQYNYFNLRYEKRLFDLKFSKSIRQILDSIEQEVRDTSSDIEYYKKRIEELDAEANRSQLKED